MNGSSPLRTARPRTTARPFWQGTRKVLSARLADAKFFWENDLRVAKSDIAQWTRALENVTFHNKLGTQAERIDRIAALARELAPVTGADADQAEKAARLARPI